MVQFMVGIPKSYVMLPFMVFRRRDWEIVAFAAAIDAETEFGWKVVEVHVSRIDNAWIWMLTFR